MPTSVPAGIHLAYVLMEGGVGAEPLKLDTCCDGLGMESLVLTVTAGRFTVTRCVCAP